MCAPRRACPCHAWLHYYVATPLAERLIGLLNEDSDAPPPAASCALPGHTRQSYGPRDQCSHVHHVERVLLGHPHKSAFSGHALPDRLCSLLQARGHRWDSRLAREPPSVAMRR